MTVGGLSPAVVHVATAATRLDPTRLAASAEIAARALLRQGESPNTRSAYSSAMRYWCAWYAARFGSQLSLPVPVPAVVQFIVDHAKRMPEPPPAPAGTSSISGQASETSHRRGEPKKAEVESTCELPPDVDEALVRGGFKKKLGPPALSTLLHRVAVLSKAHQMAGTQVAAASAHMANPCADSMVRELLARTRRGYAQRGERSSKQRAMTREPMEMLLATCDASLRGTRDRALLLFAWASGGRRRSEVANARLQDLHQVDGGDFVFGLGKSKTNQSGTPRPEDAKPIAGRAAQALRSWLAELKARGIKEGPLFLRIRRGGHLGEPLSAEAVRDIVQKRCAIAGLEGQYSAHSLRAGFVTEAGRQNLPLADTMALTGHRSVATVLGYFRSEAALTSAVSRMMDLDVP